MHTLHFTLTKNNFMKKFILPALLIGASISFTSCKKDYTCDCTITTTQTYDGELMSSSNDEYSATRNLKKKDAEEWCDGLDETSTTVSSGGFVSNTEYSCDLK